MIKAEKITKKYGAFLALDGLSFEVEKGEICGFLGPNGAGKTSTMRILTGYMPPTSGKATVAGFDPGENPLEVKKRVGYLPETAPLYTDMKVAEYLDFIAELKGFYGDGKIKRVADIMEITRLTARQGSLISSLSKGYRQRVGLAQALVGDPEVLVLDEPTIGLDPKQIVEIRSLINDLAGKRTVILSSHILPEIQMVCSRALIINGGRLVASDSLHELSGKPSSRITAKIEGPHGQVAEKLSAIAGVGEVKMDIKPGGEWVYELECGDKAPVAPQRKELVRLAAMEGWDIIELSSGGAAPLEEMYIKLISQDEAAQDDPQKEEGRDDTDDADAPEQGKTEP